MKNKYNIMHLCPHTGGGVGTVLINWILNDDNFHSIFSLGYIYEDYKIKLDFNNINYLENSNYASILRAIPNYDFIIIHYWNFPLLLHFLINNKLPDCRIITWFHNSGFNAPYTLPEQIIEISDKVIFTSPISFNLDIIKNYKNLNKFGCIWSTGGVDKYSHVNQKKHEGFNLLYIGTLDFAKLHPDFIEICYKISKEIIEAKFIIVGDGCSSNIIKQQVINYSLQNKFKFVGFIHDLIPYFEIADILLYPLSSSSYSTCEQVLGESMSCGIPPVVFNNDCEMEIVEHYRNGLVAPIDDIDKYIEQIKILYEDIEVRESLADYARIDAKEKYSLSNMINKWNRLFKEVIQRVEKKEKVFDMDRIYLPQYTKNVGEGLESFLSALDFHTAEIFSNYIDIKRDMQNLFKSNKQWYSKAKGSIRQYLEYFPDDKYLKEFEKILIETEEENKK